MKFGLSWWMADFGLQQFECTPLLKWHARVLSNTENGFQIEQYDLNT